MAVCSVSNPDNRNGSIGGYGIVAELPCVVTLHKLNLFHINRATAVHLSTTTFLESFVRQPQ